MFPFIELNNIGGGRLLGNGDIDNYFTSTERSRIVNEILARTTYGDRRKGEVGIERLLGEGIYTAAYPLHEVSQFSSLHSYYFHFLSVLIFVGWIRGNQR